MEKGAWAGFGACVPDNFIGGGLAESVTHDGVTLTRTDKELTAGDYTFSEHLLTIKTAGDYTLSGTANSNDFRVKVGDSLVTTLTIEDLTINTEGKKEQGYSPLDFSDAGATTLILVGANQLTARIDNPAVFAPWVDSGENNTTAIPLTIRGDGSLVAQGGYAWPGIGNNGAQESASKAEILRLKAEGMRPESAEAGVSGLIPLP